MIIKYIWLTPIKHKPNSRKLGSKITEWLWIKATIKIIIAINTYHGIEFNKKMQDGFIFYPLD